MTISPPRQPSQRYDLGICRICQRRLHSGDWLSGSLDAPVHSTCELDDLVNRGKMSAGTARTMKLDMMAMDQRIEVRESAHALATIAGNSKKQTSSPANPPKRRGRPRKG